jgi:hypothetical protein
LSTVRRADAIVVLDRGVVREVGRHDELLARPNGTYARLYALQMFEDSRGNGHAPDGDLVDSGEDLLSTLPVPAPVVRGDV